MKPPPIQAASIELVVFDVDGVITDGGIIFHGIEGEMKRFDSQDGMGFTLAREGGLKVGILTGRTSPMVERRARELSAAVIKQGFARKKEGWRQILQELDLPPERVAFMGDDIQDLPVLRLAGLSAAPSSAVPEVLAEVDYVCRRAGGHGAARELIDLILSARGSKAAAVAAVTQASE
ncbi:MAG: KdsC family phosphatase [Acidobacteriota bacterium]